MAIVRLTIKVLQGTREGDDDASHAAAVSDLMNLQSQVAGTPGVTLYERGEDGQPLAPPWGVPIEPGTFNVDLDTGLADEAAGDAQVLALVHDFLLTRPDPSV
jgi:hypothetical protein